MTGFGVSKVYRWIALLYDEVTKVSHAMNRLVSGHSAGRVTKSSVAIALWDTVYLTRATNALLQYLSPLGWEHTNWTGDYVWLSSARIGAGKFRPLWSLHPASLALFSEF